MCLKKLFPILVSFIPIHSWAQVTMPSCFINPLTSGCASQHNLQYSNPAAFTSKDAKGQVGYLDVAPRLSDLGGLGYIRYYQIPQAAFYHQLSFLYQAACPQIQTAHALGLRATARLQIGLGFQLKWLIQPVFYGSRAFLSARIGTQYAISDQQLISLTLEDVGNSQGQQLGLAYKQELNNGAALSMGFRWKLPFQPSWFLAISKPFNNGQADFTYSFFPQQFQFTLLFQKFKNMQLLVSQGWNKGLGTYVQLGIKF